MNAEAAMRLAAAARRRGLSPRQLLVLAMHQVETGTAPAAAAPVEAADLLLTPPARYARDDLARLLARLWPDARTEP